MTVLRPILKHSLRQSRRFYATSLDSEYAQHASFLKRLGIQEANDGVYYGKWTGSGEVGTEFLLLPVDHEV